MTPATKVTRPTLLLPVLLLAFAGCGGEDSSDSRAAEDFGGASVATESSRSETDAGLEEISDYRLNMADVERWHEAQRNLYRRVERNPELAEQIAGLDLSGASMDELEDSFSAEPEVRESIEEAGLEPREFVLILFSLYQASVAHAMTEMGTDPDSILESTGTHPDNVEFVGENQARLEQLQEETDALMPPELEEGYSEDL